MLTSCSGHTLKRHHTSGNDCFLFFRLKMCSPDWQIVLRNNEEVTFFLFVLSPFLAIFKAVLIWEALRLLHTRELFLPQSNYTMEVWDCVCDRQILWNKRENNLVATLLFLVSNKIHSWQEWFLVIYCRIAQQ